MQTQNKQKLIVAAIASRCYVKAAVESGFDVIAIDCFSDVDTRKLAEAVHQIPFIDGGLDGACLLDVIASINLQEIAGFCYGSGFEMQPELLSKINETIEVVGNLADVVLHCKDANRFFETCDALAIPYPDVVFEKPSIPESWLVKMVGGSGGSHIKQLQNSELESTQGVYFQRYQAGMPVSCLFLANSQGVDVIGFSEQWLDGDVHDPFRHGGLVSHADISDLAKARFVSYVRKLSKRIGLVGLNSCDAICINDDVVVLEINPRLSATIDLYCAEQPSLIARHVGVCHNEMLGNLVDVGSKTVHVAQHVIYAKNDMVAEAGFSWPAWTADIPECGSLFEVGMPVCTVTAEASTVMEAKDLVQSRVSKLRKQFLN